ncbi:hypothetical protein ANO11243_038030 [Dothideomycetidae sp. 11243]|nr:hypothetical protein ANO11243_038030 [fungal sp. No.11243]
MNSALSGRQRPTPLNIADTTSTFKAVAHGERTTTPSAGVKDIPSQPAGDHSQFSPPSTPPTRSNSGVFSQLPPQTPALKPIAGDITFDLDGADLLGSGLWSNVYRTQIAFPEPINLPPAVNELLTPPNTPQKSRSNEHMHVYAVKQASRPDAKEVFQEEARLLSYISLDSRSSQYVIPFYGLFNSSTSILFHCASTTLLDYSQGFADLSCVSGLMETFPAISSQLISGLSFLHSLRVIHSDIKPANVLIDFTPTGPLARYCDFSASMLYPLGPDSPLLLLDPTLPDSPASSAPVSRANSQRKTPGAAGGTWSFMAPEQLAANPLINEPSYSSDVYALGITLLTLLMGGTSPYAAVEQQNIFLLREAIKMGTPFSFIRNEPALARRLKAIAALGAGSKAIESINLACKKKKGPRITALGWAAWAET